MRGEQLARQWRLVQRLARSRVGVGLDELAEDLECTRRTVYRDLDALMMAGFPVLSERRDGRVRYRFLESFQLGDVPFTPDEVLALAFGADLLRVLEGTVFHDSIRSALDKIRAGLSDELKGYLARLGDAFRVLPGPHKRYRAYRETIECLSRAALGRQTVRIRYRTGTTGRVTRRDLDPYRVWYRGTGLYVVGHDHRSREIRTFAVDRIERIDLLDRRFEVDPDFDFDRWAAGSFGVVSEPATRVRIHFDRRWASYVSEHEWHPTQRSRPLPGGGLELELAVGPTAELRSWILSFGDGARVLEPGSLRREVTEELRRALDRYRDEAGPAPEQPAGDRARARGPAPGNPAPAG